VSIRKTGRAEGRYDVFAGVETFFDDGGLVGYWKNHINCLDVFPGKEIV
jgi:hypothetical protein